MTIEKRSFGRTGHMSSAVIFGSAALKAVDQGVADRVLDLLFEHGVNHIDTAPSYGDAELRIGPWMDRHRDAFFLATKTDQWSFEGAKAQIRRSLERLRTDHVDLMQLHALTHPDQWEQALSPGGALDAVQQARAEGLVRFIGVTGHGWTVAAMHRRSLERFDFDSVLMPWNWLCAHHPTYAADFEATVALMRAAQRRGADDQGAGARALGSRRRTQSGDLVSAVGGRGGHSRGSALGVGAAAAVSELGGRPGSVAAGAPGRGRARSGTPGCGHGQASTSVRGCLRSSGSEAASFRRQGAVDPC